MNNHPPGKRAVPSGLVEREAGGRPALPAVGGFVNAHAVVRMALAVVEVEGDAQVSVIAHRNVHFIRVGGVDGNIADAQNGQAVVEGQPALAAVGRLPDAALGNAHPKGIGVGRMEGDAVDAPHAADDITGDNGGVVFRAGRHPSGAAFSNPVLLQGYLFRRRPEQGLLVAEAAVATRPHFLFMQPASVPFPPFFFGEIRLCRPVVEGGFQVLYLQRFAFLPGNIIEKVLGPAVDRKAKNEKCY